MLHNFKHVLFASLLLGGLAACGGAVQDGAVAGTAAPQQTYRWKLITTWPKNLPALGTAPERFAQMVDRMSGGRLKIRVYGAGELVGAFEVFDAVLSGDAELGHGAAYYWRGKVPEAAFFTAVPFGLTAQEMNGWLYYGGGLALWQELYAPFGLIPFPGGNTGVQMGGWFNKEINSLADLQGLRMRIPGLGGEVFQRAGGEPVSMPGGDMYTALQTGTIDATDWVGPYNDLAFGLHDVARYYYYPGWQEPGAVMETIVNKEAFEGLPEDLQAIIEVATRAMNEDMLAEYTARNNTALRDLLGRGVQLRRFPDDVLARLRTVSDEVLAEMGQTSPMAERIHASFTAFSKDVKAWTAISEYGYLDARTQTDPASD
ncbi:MAG: TRAP transporter substrate-binding protein DctP [Pseudomonadales bacterium]|jgi:TRAP-type mannitol/chloroaromatic compound transport system substrate-binding protein|nr:TRAP transporter substrate-binding protein DctP [Pseudomonadales bacterium]